MIAACALAAKAQDDVAPDFERTSEKTAWAVGKLFVHTARGYPLFTINGVETHLEAGDFVDAKGVSVETAGDQCLTLIFSNKTAIYVNGPSKFTIEKFDQMQPFPPLMRDESESSRTTLRMSIESGELYVSALRPRPSSKFIIKTKFGIFEPLSKAFKMTADADAVRMDLLDGQARFFTLTDKSDFLQAGQTGTVDAKSGDLKYPLLAKVLPMSEADKYWIKIDYARIAATCVLFILDDENRLTATKVIPKEFFLRTPKYDFRAR